jgi:hypothetical protein
MTTWQIIIIAITCFVIGYHLGHWWATWQWLHCAQHGYAMRLKKKYLYKVKFIGVE